MNHQPKSMINKQKFGHSSPAVGDQLPAWRALLKGCLWGSTCAAHYFCSEYTRSILTPPPPFPATSKCQQNQRPKQKRRDLCLQCWTHCGLGLKQRTGSTKGNRVEETSCLGTFAYSKRWWCDCFTDHTLLGPAAYICKAETDPRDDQSKPT